MSGFNSVRCKRITLAGVTLTLLGGLALAPPGDAASPVTGSIAVTSTVEATCLQAVTPLPFGTYTGLAAVGTATITITCTNTTPYTIALDVGVGTGATEALRVMTGPGAAALTYTLSSDAGHSIPWGTTTGAIAGIGNGAAQPLTVYGQEAAGQYVAPGAYTDTVTATLTY